MKKIIIALSFLFAQSLFADTLTVEPMAAKQVFDKIKENFDKAAKSDFETEAEYNKRISNMPADTTTYYIIITTNPGKVGKYKTKDYKTNYYYNAETKDLEVLFGRPINRQIFVGGMDKGTADINIDTEVNDKDKTSMQNGFGATYEISIQDHIDRILCLTKSTAKKCPAFDGDYFKVIVNAQGSKAQSIIDNGVLVIGFKHTNIKDVKFYDDTNNPISPTPKPSASFPYRITQYNEILRTDLVSVIFYDKTTKEVLYQWKY